MNRDLTPHDTRLAQEAVERFNSWNLLGKNTKLTETEWVYQIRIWDTLRVQFKVQEDGEKEIIDVFRKWNHDTHR